MKRYYLAGLIGLFLIPIALLVPTARDIWRSQPAEEKLSPRDNPFSPLYDPNSATATLYEAGQSVRSWVLDGDARQGELGVVRFTEKGTGRDVVIFGHATVVVRYPKPKQ